MNTGKARKVLLLLLLLLLSLLLLILLLLLLLLLFLLLGEGETVEIKREEESQEKEAPRWFISTITSNATSTVTSILTLHSDEDERANKKDKFRFGEVVEHPPGDTVMIQC